MAESKKKSIVKACKTVFLHPFYFLYCIFCGMKTVIKMAYESPFICESRHKEVAFFLEIYAWRNGVKRG